MPEGVTGQSVCIYCADENTVLFVETPPDGHGPRYINKSIKEVREADGGNWHKNGRWVDQQTAFRGME